jgi:hypothetical protein
MRIALLGLDQTTLKLARAALINGRDQLVLCCDVPETERPVVRGMGIREEDWEVLLTGATGDLAPCDAVIVARDAFNDEQRLEQLRKLVQAPLAMLVSHPVHVSMLAYYELDMIRRETGCVVVPVLPNRLHPLAVQLHELIRAAPESPLGAVEQLSLERALPQRDKSSVIEQFARDVDLLRFLGGEIMRLGAMGSPGTTARGELAAFNNLNVQMAAAENRLIRWTVVAADDLDGARLTVTGDRGRAILLMPQRDGPWQLELRGTAGPAVSDAPAWDPEVASLDELRFSLSGTVVSRWPQAARAIELAETIDRSLAKGRMIDLYEQEYSPSATFKGLMSSLGCALLMLALAGMVIGALAANLLKHAGFDRAAQIVGMLPYAFLGLFVLFLAAQFLLTLAGTAHGEQSAAPPARSEDLGNS